MLKSVFETATPVAEGRYAADGIAFGAADLLRLLRRRRRFIAAATAATAGAAAAVAVNLTPLYSTDAVLVFERSDTRVLEALADVERQQVDLSAVQTEMDVLKTRLFVGKVVDALGLADDAAPDAARRSLPGRALDAVAGAAGAVAGAVAGTGDAGTGAAAAPAPEAPPSEASPRDVAIDRLLGSMSLHRSDQSLAVTIRVRDRDPLRAAGIANAVGEIYIDWSLELKRSAAESAYEFFRERATRSQERITELEREIVDFSDSHGLSSASADDTLRGQISRIAGEVAGARVERGAAEVRLAKLRALAEGPGHDGPGGAGAIATSPLLETLRAQMESVAQRRADLSAALGPRHPDRLAAEAEMARVAAAIGEETARVLERHDYDLAVATERLSGLEADLARLDRLRRDRSLAEIRLRQLENELAFERRQFDRVLDSLTTLDRQAEALSPSARFLSEAPAPAAPSWPNVPVLVGGVTVGAAALAFVVALVLEGLDTRVRSAARVLAVLGVPTLAFAPALRRPVFGQRPAPGAVVEAQPASSYAEAMLALWRGLTRRCPEPKAVVLIVSSLPDEGAPGVAGGLAAAAARQGRRVAALDLGGGLGGALGLPDGIAGGGTLVGSGTGTGAGAGADGGGPAAAAPLATATATARIGAGIDLFRPARPGGVRPADDEVAAFVRGLRDRYDFVVLLAPPLLASDEADMLATLVDAMALVVRWGATREETLLEAAEQLRLSPAPLAGVVIAEVDERRHSDGRYGGRAEHRRKAGHGAG
jgi:uncharacterized protein involved in exopolysaccharide biosynthesis/Mrp family chromosome partitioning ATPase